MARLQEAAVKQISEICDRYKDEETPLMMILSDIQKEYGYIPLEVQELVSEKTGISVAEIYGVVTFYSFFSLKPKGKNVIGCCLFHVRHTQVCCEDHRFPASISGIDNGIDLLQRKVCAALYTKIIDDKQVKFIQTVDVFVSIFAEHSAK